MMCDKCEAILGPVKMFNTRSYFWVIVRTNHGYVVDFTWEDEKPDIECLYDVEDFMGCRPSNKMKIEIFTCCDECTYGAHGWLLYFKTDKDIGFDSLDEACVCDEIIDAEKILDFCNTAEK